MVLHLRCVPERSEGNPCLRGYLMELCSKGDYWVCAQSPQCLTSIRNWKTYEYISMNNIQLV